MTGIDTTFLIDLEILESPRHTAAVEVFNNWRNEKNSILVIYSNVFNEFFSSCYDKDSKYILYAPYEINQLLNYIKSDYLPYIRMWYYFEKDRRFKDGCKSEGDNREILHSK